MAGPGIGNHWTDLRFSALGARRASYSSPATFGISKKSAGVYNSGQLNRNYGKRKKNNYRRLSTYRFTNGEA